MAIVLSPDGGQSVRETAEGSAADAEQIGRELGAGLLGRGAARILHG